MTTRPTTGSRTGPPPAADARPPGGLAGRSARSSGGMAATARPEATDAAAGVLAAGGSAVDAAVAAAFALCVCEPAASGLGGQTMIVLHDASSGRTTALDGSSRAPHRVVPGELEEAKRLRGHRATTVPSTPAVLAYALAHHGTMPLAQALEPAIRIAEEGFRVSPLQHRLASREAEHLRAASAGRFFLREDGEPHGPGELLRQPALARMLRRLAEAGIEDFYRGEIAAAMCADLRAHGALIHADDLAQIPWPLEKPPVEAALRGRRIATMGPPGAGHSLVEMLRVLDRLPPLDLDEPLGALLFAEVDHRVQLERKDRPFDPRTYPRVPEKERLAPRHADEIAEEVRRAVDEARGETTHLSVMDARGNAASLTQSIERVFGCFEASPELGFLYNNYMSTFDYTDIAHPYYLRPGASPWASVAPTVVLEGDRAARALGSPGSQRIVSVLGQVLLRLEREEPLEAVTAPRLHGAADRSAHLEAPRMDPEIPALLERRGFRVVPREAWSFHLGCVQLVARDGGELVGIADPRRDGTASGPRA